MKVYLNVLGPDVVRGLADGGGGRREDELVGDAHLHEGAQGRVALPGEGAEVGGVVRHVEQEDEPGLG